MSKYKRINLGKKEEYPTTESSSKSKSRINYPTFYVERKLPISKDAVGKTFEVQAKIKCIGVSENTNEDGNKLDYRFEMINIDI